MGAVFKVDVAEQACFLTRSVCGQIHVAGVDALQGRRQRVPHAGLGLEVHRCRAVVQRRVVEDRGAAVEVYVLACVGAPGAADYRRLLLRRMGLGHHVVVDILGVVGINKGTWRDDSAYQGFYKGCQSSKKGRR